MSNNLYSPDELALGIKLILEKNRDTLSVTEINLLEDVLINLQKLDRSDNKRFFKLSLNIIARLIKFFHNNGTSSNNIDYL